MSPRTYGLSMAILTAVLWSMLAIGLKFSLSFATSGNIVWYRMLLAFGTLTVWVYFRKPEDLKILGSPPGLGLLAGLGLAANYDLFMRGVQYTTASNAQIMIQSGPLALILIGVFYFKEIPSRLQIIGFFVAILGFGLFFRDQWEQGGGDHTLYLRGNLMIYAAGMAWAMFATFQKILFQRYSSAQINLLVYGVSLACLWPMADFHQWSAFTGWQWFILSLLGINTLVAYAAFGESLRRIPASHTSLIITLNPLGTILFMQLLAYWEAPWITPEPLLWIGYMGASCVVLGVVMAVYKKGNAQQKARG